MPSPGPALCPNPRDAAPSAVAAGMAHLPPLREAPSPPRDNSSPRQLPHRLLDGGAVVSAFGLNMRSFKFSSAPSVLEAGSLHPDSTPRSSQVLTCQWCGQRVLLCIHCPVLILRVPCPLDCRVLFLTVLCPRKPLSPAQSRTACHPPPTPPHVSPDLGPPLVKSWSSDSSRVHLVPKPPVRLYLDAEGPDAISAKQAVCPGLQAALLGA